MTENNLNNFENTKNIIEGEDNIKIYENFEDLELKDNLLRGIYAMGYEKPSAIQQKAIKPFYEDYEIILFNSEARANHNTIITVEGERHWSVRQVLLDEQGDRLWYLKGEINLMDQETPEGALVTLLEISAHGV